jgi:hypothetical protein
MFRPWFDHHQAELLCVDGPYYIKLLLHNGMASIQKKSNNIWWKAEHFKLPIWSSATSGYFIFQK